jgi:Family of unknown function (DUF5906)
VKIPNGIYIPVNETSLTTRLDRLTAKERDRLGILIGDKKDWVTDVQNLYGVDQVCSVSGHPLGVYEFNGQQILVPRAAKITQSTDGSNRIIWNYIDRLLGETQALRLHAWNKLSREMLIRGDYGKFMGMIIAGPRDLGKTVLAEIEKQVFNGTSADPYSYMTNSTNFNRDLVEAALLVSDDREDDPTQAGNRRLTSAIKQFTASGVTRIEGKYANAGALDPFWRLLILLNDSIKALQVLKGLSHEMLDKVMILKAVARAVNVPTTTLDERRAFLSSLTAGVPDYLGQLEKWTIPTGLVDNRFMLKAWHHPELMVNVQATSKEATLLELIDRSKILELTPDDVAENQEIEVNQLGVFVTLNELHRRWVEDCDATYGHLSQFAKMVEKMFPTVGTLAMHMNELAKSHPERVIRTERRAPKRVGQGPLWLLKGPQ